MAASLCLGLLLMAVSSIEAQTTSPSLTSSRTVYLPSMTYDSAQFAEGSLIYNVVKGQIEQMLSDLGGSLTKISFADGGGCLQVDLTWTGAEQFLGETGGVLEDSGIVVLGITFPMNLEGCSVSPSSTSSPQSTPNELSTTTLFLSGLIYTAELNDSTSEMYLSIRTVVQTLLIPTEAVLEDMDFADGGGCLRMWLQTRGGNIGAQSELFTTLTETGIDLLGVKLNVSFDQCGGPSTPRELTTATLYLTGLFYNSDLKDPTSVDYNTIKTVVQGLLAPTGAVLEDIDFADGGGCLRMWMQTSGGNVSALSELITTLTRTGIDVMDHNIYVSNTECHDTLCSFFTEQPCGANGQCRGNSPYGKEWQMCSCNEGFSGLFCEKNKTDDLTECERMRDFNLFVHGQITGEEKPRKSMKATMKEIMASLLQNSYSVPYCYPSSNISRENFYTMCDYDTRSGQKLECYCVNGRGARNYAYYFGEDDCRTYAYLAQIKEDMFIHNLDWSDDMAEDNDLYTSLTSQIIRHMTPAGGFLSELKLSPRANGKCVHLYIHYEAENSVQGRKLLYALPGSSLMVKDENKTVSLFPCKEDIDVNACPKIQPGSVSICLFECSSNNDCKDNLTCCNIACGGGICRELGYLQKMKANITMNIDFLSEYETEGSIPYGIMEDNVVNAIDALMSSEGIAAYRSVKVLGFRRAKPMPRYRKRRQAIPEADDTLILLEFQFTEEIPVDKIMVVRDDLLEKGFNFASMNYEVLRVGLGQEGGCGDNGECSYGSICVERLGGQAECACPTGRTGRNCRMTVCQNPDGSSLCHNDAPCQYDEAMYGYRCHCKTGFHGKYCETNVCGLFKQDACNENSCAGDVVAMELCKCPPGKAGLFCQYNVEPEYNQTLCEKHHAFASYVLSILNGSNSGSELSGNVSQLLPLFNSTRDILLVPRCRYDNPLSLGEYHYYCAYDTKTGQRSVDQDCLCVNGDGTPNYWTFYNGQCVVYVDQRREACDRNPCANGGVCHNMPNDDFSCTCPPGYHGRTCQEHHMDQCPYGGPPLYQSWGVWTCGDKRPCPAGFHCHGDSFNGSCCFKPDFLCDFKLCQNDAPCAGDLHSGQICHCPPGKAGLFCDEDDDGVKLTQCQMEQQFVKWVEQILRTGVTPEGSTLEDFRRILIHTGITYVPTDICDDEGAFKTLVDSVSVLNVNDVKTLCFDKHGDLDPLCKDVICDTVEPFGICRNGGRCIGDFTRAFCDCTGTGFHGPRCNINGEENRTQCTQVRDFIHFALRIVNGSEQIIPGLDISGAVQDLFELTQIPLVFEPYCDDYGRYAYKGCAHFLPTLETKLCYCTSEDFQQVGDALSITEPPERCPLGPDQCPHEWGPECIRPDWWCTHEIKCKRGKEKCYFAVECDDEECLKTPRISCVPDELKLPCEPQPCKHNKYKMCPPCGEEASCFHVSRDDFDSNDKDDDDDDSDEDKEDKGKDDNDSEEKRANAKADDDNDSDEKRLSWMRPPKGQNYICECPTGRSGPNCEVHDEICKSIPPWLCPDGCTGDLEHGVLCSCPEGYAGITCEKVARTPCEIKQAFFGDSLNVLRGLFTVPGIPNSELRKLVQVLVGLTGGDSIPETNCTENGFYEKVQCDVNVYDTNQKHCYCVNQRGEYVASNVVPHIGFEVCTGPLDMRTMVGVCLRQDVQICQNGGSCVFDLYEGKLCDCPHGYHGQLCERPGQPEDESQSFCEFMRDSYSYVQDMLRNNRTRNNVAAMYLYQIMSSFIDVNSNRTTNGHLREYVGLKTECQPDGQFMHYTCDHDLLTDERIACYCLGYNGPLIGTEAPNPESLDCSEARSLSCHELDDCPYLECDHGHRHNLQYCPICECKHPCEGHKCLKGERCVVEDFDCDKHDEKCTKPVCVPMHKPGVCPRHKPEYISSIRDGLKSNASMYGDDTCQVSCHDDADCEGSKKCCGLCGTMCVEPEESDDCTHQYDIMMEYLEFIRESRNLSLVPNTPRSLLKTVDQTEEMDEIWVPRCLDSNYVPVQCMYNVSALLMGSRMMTQCFCVDRLGHRIKDSIGLASNESSCDVKPFSCPTLRPSTGDSDVDECMEDLDCAKNSKCCFDGLHHVCSEPVAEPADDYVIDIIMDNVCDSRPDVCPSGTCMSTWRTDGKVCECGTFPNMMGPFCEVPTTAETPKPRTACERKRLTTYLFWMSFEKIMTTDTASQNYSTIDHLVEFAIETMLEDVPEDEREKIPIVMYECDDDGSYEPVQCDLSFYTGKKMECFCVDEEGKELPGTRKPADEQLPFCRREQMCDMGHALHGEDGNLVTCGKDRRCPYGYSCARGVYGNLYCCPSKGKTDICNHPVDMGFECEDGTPSELYRYRADTDRCESFNFKGCGGNRNSFESMDHCEKRCVDKMHIGSCPSTPFEVAKVTGCKDQCKTDSDCPSDWLKCCSSTCGKRCIPAIDESPAEGRCPVGPPKSEPETCEYVSQCGDGYTCRFTDDDVTKLYRTGYCCLDVETKPINYCRVRPLLMGDMREDSSEEKDDEEEEKDDDDDDEDEKDDDMNKHDRRDMPCEKLKARYYFNHENLQCEMYHGCEVDFNTFETREDCCETCSIERRCKVGRCPNVRSDIPVSCRDECISDNQCEGEKICCNTGCSLNCVPPHDESNSTCFAAQREAKRNRALSQRGSGCNTVYIPMCEENGDYARQQCHSSLGICWCVTARGNYISPSLTRGVASCHHYSEVDMNLADTYPENVHDVDFQVCPQGEQVHCCAENLCEKRCRAHPEAMCRINPCGGCSAEYFDADNNVVNCEEGLTPCQLELQNALKVISARSITANMEEEEERRREMAQQMYNGWSSAIRADVPLKCQKAPETGNCKGFQRRWFYNHHTRKCSMFIWGMCGGNSNRFRTPKECYDECDPGSNPCATVRCGLPTPNCVLTYDENCYSFEGGCLLQPECTERETNTNHVEGVFIPRCFSSGAYNNKQCHGRFCWCVDDNGEYVDGLTSTAYYGDLQCTSSGATAESVITLPDCPGGSYTQKPQHKCLKECSGKVCPGYPKAECVVDLCSESCTTMFKDADGNVVNCGEDECKAFSFDTENRTHCSEGVLCDGENVRSCPSTVCENAKQTLCPQNPCAVCMVDSCTCEPYFIDVMTSEVLDTDSSDCKYLSKGTCTAQTCKLMIDNVPTDQLPQCTSAGAFMAKQCHDSFCYCVGAEGNFIKNVTADGNCDEIDEVAKLEITLAFDADFDSLMTQGRLSKLKEEVRNFFMNELGVPSSNIYISEPYRGSVVFDVIIQENKDEPTDANINLIANSYTQKLEEGINLDIDGESVGLLKDESTFVLVPASVVATEEVDDDDDDGLSDKEIIIIAACSGGAALLILTVIICCCCCRKNKKPEVVDDTYDHIREGRQNDKNVYDNPVTMYNNKSFEGEGHYMDIQDTERYQKVRL